MISNVERVSQDLGTFISESGAVESVAVTMVSKNVIRNLLAMTPPFKTLSPFEGFGIQRSVGQFAVKRDLSRAFHPLDDLKVVTALKKPLVFDKVKKAIDKHNPALMAIVLNALGYQNLTSSDFVDAATIDIHNSLRKKGRVPKGTRGYFVFQKASFATLEDMRLNALGRGKAGWAAAAWALGIPLPAWITIHGSPGVIRDRSKSMVDPSFSAKNNVDYLLDFAGQNRLIDLAIGRSADSLERQINARRLGLWNKKR